MFASVLAPVLTKLSIAHEAFDQLAEICTTQGVVKQHATASGADWVVQRSGEPARGSGDQHSHGDDCPYCHLQLAKLVSAQRAASIATRSEPAYPSLFYRAPRPLFAWARMPARAPPTFL